MNSQASLEPNLIEEVPTLLTNHWRVESILLGGRKATCSFLNRELLFATDPHQGTKESAERKGVQWGKKGERKEVRRYPSK